MFNNYFKIAWRNLFRSPTVSIINISGLVIGMTAAVLIMVWVNNELSFDAYHPDASQIYRTRTALPISANQTWVWNTSPYVLADEAVKQIPGVINATRLQPVDYGKLYINYNGKLQSEKKCAYVDNQWFNIFHYDFIDGNASSFNHNPRSLILTASTAKRYFGNKEAVGQTLKIDSTSYQVQAVVKDNPANSSFQFDILLPVAAKITDEHSKKELYNWNNFNSLTFLKLQPGTDTAKVSRQLQVITHRVRKEDKNSISLTSLKDIHFETDIQNPLPQTGNRKMVTTFMVLGFIILLIACINYINLSTAKASLRSKEVSIRKIVGARRSNLFAQFMAESLLVSSISLSICILLLQLLLPLFNSITGKMFLSPLLLPSTWWLLSGTLLICFVLNGLYPALLLSSFNPLKVFKNERISFKDSYLRQILVIVQFSASVVLIIATMVIYLQLKYMQQTDLGFNRAHIFSFSIPWSVHGFGDKNKTLLNTIKNELKQQTAIDDVAQTSSDEFYNNTSQNSGNADWDGRAKGFNPSVASLSADDHLLSFLHLKMKRGRWFSPASVTRHEFILNETAVQTLGIHQPVIDQRFSMGGDTGIIVGIVKDFHYQNLHAKIGPMIIDNNITWAGSFYIKTAPGNTTASVKAAEAVYHKFVSNEPFEYTFMDEGYNRLYHTEQRSSILIMIFAAIAIFISALGLFGLAAFAAEQRVKEVGIRKVLGATVTQITTLLSVSFVKMVLVANLVAFPLAWWLMNNWLQNFAYRIHFTWWIFALSGLAAIIIALLTTSFQTIKAALINPVKSLRSE